MSFHPQQQQQQQQQQRKHRPCFITSVSTSSSSFIQKSPNTSSLSNISSTSLIQRPSRKPQSQSQRRHYQPPVAAAWPLSRFFSNFLFYTPLGKALRGSTPSTTPTINSSSAPMSFTDDQAIAAEYDKKTILVLGASGATGSRVVAKLLATTNHRVIALARSRDKLYAALKSLEVSNIREKEYAGVLNVIISDIKNLPQDVLFDVDCCICCTGTKTGPADDDENRSKYYQGVILYPAEILEDNPQNIEYKSISNIVNTLSSDISSPATSNIQPFVSFSLFDYRTFIHNQMKLNIEWGSLDDVVMGGVSESQIVQNKENGVLYFTGTVKTENNGGFVSTRSYDFDNPIDLSKFNGVQLRVYGDGNRYKFIFRCEKRWDGYAHCVSFDTKKDTWQLINIPFEQFNSVLRGKTIDKEDSKFKASQIYAMQFMLSKFEYDGELNPSFEKGDFQLLIASIRPYVNVENAKQAIQWVHLSSAAVTRPQRLAEVRGTAADVPILQLNEKIGNLLDWKLAGEDAVRSSDLNYVIVRSCALTLEPEQGIDKLKFDQGDLMNGRVSRDDAASLMVNMIDSYDHANTKTFEVATVDEENDSLDVVKEGVSDRLDKLQNDQQFGRSFGPFPYVPDVQPAKAGADVNNK